jgi:hypothetical protein
VTEALPWLFVALMDVVGRALDDQIAYTTDDVVPERSAEP